MTRCATCGLLFSGEGYVTDSPTCGLLGPACPTCRSFHYGEVKCAELVEWVKSIRSDERSRVAR